MKKIPGFISIAGTALVLCLSFVKPVAAQQWTPLGPNAEQVSTSSTFITTMAIASDGTPYVAFREESAGQRISVKKFNGSTWEYVGPSSFTAGPASTAKLAFAPDGTLYMAYFDAWYGNIVMKFNGSNWEQIGAILGYGGNTNFAIAPNGTLYIAYDNGQYSLPIVQKFDGSQWVGVGSPGVTNNQCFYFSLAIAPDNTPYFAFDELQFNYKASFKKFDGTDWVYVGPKGFTYGNSNYNNLVFAPDGTPYLGYQDQAYGLRALVKKYNGSTWEDVGAPVSPGVALSENLIVSASGTLYMGYSDNANSGKMTVNRYKNNVWEYVGLPGFSTDPVAKLSIGIYGDSVIAAYSDNSASPYAQYFEYTPTCIGYTWGGSNGNWSDPANWLCGIVPITGSENVSIPAGSPVLDVNYTVASTYSLIINGTGGLTIAPGKTFGIAGSADFGGRPVTIQSNAAATGAIGEITGTLTGETNVTVERYLPVAGVASGRSWRLLTIPVTSPTATIRDAWAGHEANGNAPATEVGGSGTNITGTAFGDGITAANTGYDWWGAIAYTASSIRSYTINGANGGWYATPLTSGKLDTAQQGYMLFVRGDRTVTTGSGNTTLRPNGKIKKGQQSYGIPDPGTAAYKVIGNPYAATISFENMMTNGSNSTLARNNRFHIWDANMGTNGGYRLVNKLGAGNWIRIPAAFSDPSPSKAEYIQSSQAFIIETLLSGSLKIEESNKMVPLVGGPPSVFDASNAGRLYTNLNLDNGGGNFVLSDGILASFDAGSNNAIDANDAGKIDNFNENISLLRNGKRLTLEARTVITDKDTLYFQLSNLSTRNYAFQFKGVQMQNDLTAKLVDTWAGKEYAVSIAGDITTVNFSVTSDASSAAADRFRIIFKADRTLSLTLTSAKAYQQNNGIQVDWKTLNEKGIKNYEVEKSADGNSFNKTISVTALGGAENNYGWFDAAPFNGDNYYRIKLVGSDGKISYSQVLRISTSAHQHISSFAVFPNPVKGRSFSIQLNNMEKGRYVLAVFNSAGQKVLESKITNSGGSAIEVITSPRALASGVYRVSLISSNGNTLNQILVLER